MDGTYHSLDAKNMHDTVFQMAEDRLNLKKACTDYCKLVHASRIYPLVDFRHGCSRALGMHNVDY